MSPEFHDANQEALDEAEFYVAVNPRDYQPMRWVAVGLESLGEGIAWAGFWIGLGYFLAHRLHG